MNNYQAQILEKLCGASTSVNLAVAWLTDTTLLQKLIDKASLGTTVSGYSGPN